MKHSKLKLFLIFLSTITFSAVAQTPCATVETPQQRAELMKLKPFLNDYQKSNEKYYIPIQFHNVGKNDGSGRWSKFQVIQNIADVNEDYAPYNMQFFLYQANVNDVNSTTLYDHDDFGVDGLMNQNETDNVVNIFTVDDPAGACGYYTYGADGIMINKSCAGVGNTTVTHELGHYFGLPHTFSGWEGGNPPNQNFIERVPRSGEGANCNSAADSFCDTGPDYVSDRWGCPYAVLSDPDGNTFRPDSSFYMSYSLDECQSRHSNQQVASMKAQIDNFRPYLKNHNTTAAQNTDEVGNMYLVYPANEATVPSNVTISWKSVMGATHYALYVIDLNDGKAIVDRIITDTTFTFNNLPDALSVLWRVRPFHQGNYSATPPQERRFKVNADQNITVESFDAQQPSCLYAYDGSLTFEATGGTAPYQYVWSDGTQGNTLTDIPGGIYTCTVTDANNETADLKFSVEQPKQLNSSVIVQYGATVASATGGTLPYNYQWSTSDETTKIATNLQAGQNKLIITDANGCESEFDFVYIVPNVVANNVTCYGDNNGSLYIFGAEGGQGNYSYRWEDGSTFLVRENLSAGEYTLKTTDAQGNSTFSTYVITQADAPLVLNFTQNANDISITTSGGVAPIQLIWSDGETATLNQGESATRTNLPLGNYMVFASDANGCSINQTFIVNQTTANTTLENSQFNALFNANGNLLLQANVNQTAKLQLFNIQGTQILTQQLPTGSHNQEFALPNLPSGMYFLQIQANGKATTLKLVK